MKHTIFDPFHISTSYLIFESIGEALTFISLATMLFFAPDKLCGKDHGKIHAKIRHVRQKSGTL